MELSKTSSISSLLLCIILVLSIPKLVSPQANSFTYKWCSDTLTYTPNSAYQSNLKTVLNSLSTDTRTNNSFYNFTVGQKPDEISSFAFCRGDVPVDTCRGCIQTAAKLIVGSDGCPNQKQAFGFSGFCSIYFTNGTIYGKVQDNVLPTYITKGDTISNATGFNQTLHSLMNSLLQDQAASGNSSLKYAAGKRRSTGGQDLYGLVQCSPDLSKKSCVQCIQDLFSIFPDCCIKPKSTASGVTIVEPSCLVQYDINPFYGNVPNLPLSSPPAALRSNQTQNRSSSRTAGRKSERSHRITAVSISIGMSTILVISIVYSIISRRRRLRSKSAWMVKFSKDEIEALESLKFHLGTVKNATHNFSDEYKLGEGGFGTVYKGVLSDGQEIAVKRCLRNSGQGDAEFKNEILILAKLQHKNLVKLLGFCLHGKEMILIYEFVANRSLDYFVFGRSSNPPMMWETRYKIINGIVRGILYLHEESRLKIIHRDLKAGNVLLDADFNPKIADFGMARLFNIDQTQTMASKIVGTLGYISPEYALQHQVSVKSDVYSFGVLVLEIVSGKTIGSFGSEDNQENLLSFAWRNWTEGTGWNLVDPTIKQNSSSTEILRCIHIGLLCVQDNPADRPTMSSVALMLSSYSITLQVPLQPAFFTDSSSLPNMLSEWTTSTAAATSTSTASHKSESRSAKGSVNAISITE